MNDRGVVFDDAAAYERFMGKWSRVVGTSFLKWVAPSPNVRWLDVGCGTGVFTQLVLDTCSPSTLVGIDPAVAQIDHARQQPAARVANFRVADAQSLPFEDQSFDIVTSALVLNFIPDRHRALAEMRRVARPGGIVCAYVWDFAAGRGTAWPLVRGMRQIGVEVPKVPGTEDTSISALRSLFEQAGFEEIDTQAIDVTVPFADFNDFWHSQVPPFTPNGKAIFALNETDRSTLMEVVKGLLPLDPDGSFVYSARANAVKGCVPQ